MARGSFVPPTLIEIHSLAELQREVFGPVLHLLRYRREQLDALLGQVNATGYALTMGLHTRIDETIARVVEQSRAGNLYVNRNMVGAVVGVQPFGGEALSGTGPKAGGPLYLLRLLAARPDAAAAQALRHSGTDAAPLRGVASPAPAVLQALRDWAVAAGRAPLAALCERFAAVAPPLAPRTLAGPTGESNVYRLLPREAVLCLADDEADRLAQLAAVLAVGGRVLWPAEAAALAERLPEAAARPRDAGAGLDPRDGALRCAAAPRRCRRAARAVPADGRTGRADRRRDRARARAARHPAGAAGGGARAEHQHGGGGRQCQPDDHRLTRVGLSGARLASRPWPVAASRARTSPCWH